MLMWSLLELPLIRELPTDLELSSAHKLSAEPITSATMESVHISHFEWMV